MDKLARAALAVAILGLVAAGGWALRAQVQVRGADEVGKATPGVVAAFADPRQAATDALLETAIGVPFAEETPLREVAGHLAKALRVRVVLDPAALARLDVDPDDPVQLDLEGTVRLRTALPLLLDQLDLTYRFVPEDRLLILTDSKGAGDPQRQIIEELRDLHRDVHDLQEVVDALYDDLFPEEGPTIRKPTMIEENPPPPDGEEHRRNSRSRPG